MLAVMSLEETLTKLEDLRRRRFANFIADLVLAFLFSAAGLAMMIVSANDASLDEVARYSLIGVGFVLFLFSSSFCTLLAFKEKNRFDGEFFETLVPFLTPEDYRDFAYLKNPDLKALAASLKSVLSNKPYPDATSYYQGRLQGSTFFSFAYSYIKADPHHPSETGGRYLEFTTPHSFPFEMIIKDKRSPSYFKDAHLLIRLKSDSAAFDEAHDVTASKEIEGMNLLSNKMVASLSALNREYGVHVSAHYQGNKVYVYFDDYVDHYVSSLSRPITRATYESLEREVLLPIEVYKALGLDSPFYSI
jgi:hypothetical protein